MSYLRSDILRANGKDKMKYMRKCERCNVYTAHEDDRCETCGHIISREVLYICAAKTECDTCHEVTLWHQGVKVRICGKCGRREGVDT